MNFNFDFVTHRKKFFLISIIAILIGFGSILFQGLNLGVDFTSGTRIDLMTEKQLPEKDVSDMLKGLDIEPSSVTSSKGEPYTVSIMLDSEVSKDQVQEVVNNSEEKFKATTMTSEVSPQVGKELVVNAILSLLIASLGIVIYLAVRFEWIKGIATIVGVLHNVIITIGIFSIFQLEISLTFIAAILTVIGYSINDTIVTFDRIRESLKGKEDSIETFDDLAKVTNGGLNQTLTRSINTGITVLIAVVALIFLGSPAIFTFSMALAIGLIAGMYSSIFISAQLWTIWKFKYILYRKANPLKESDDINNDNDWI